jgi:hypothetical protein
LKRVKIPRFNGKVGDWAEFRHTFLAVVQMGNYPEIIQFTQFKSRLLKEAVALIAGLCEGEIIWCRLNRRYGDREVTMMATLSRILQAPVPEGANQVKVKAVAAAMRRAQALFRNVNSREEMFADKRVLTTLIDKLPEAVREGWYFSRNRGGEPDNR